MADSRSRRPYACILLVGSAFILAACANTTYGTGRSAGAQAVKDLTGLAVDRKKAGPIDYSPRPPVVAPPVAGVLPPPGARNQTVAVADWPNDPDEQARRFKEQLVAREASYDEGASVPVADPNFKLPAGAAHPPVYRDPDLTPAEAAMGSPEEDERARKAFAAVRGSDGQAFDAQGRPVRRYLTDPPAEYRLPDPEAEAAAAVACTPRKFRWPWQRRDANECPNADL